MEKELVLEFKRKVVEAFIEKFEKEIEELKKQLEQLSEDIKTAPSRMESRYDSRRQELSYLQSGYQQKLISLLEDLDILKSLPIEKKDKVEKGALIKTSDNDYFLILDCCGGKEVEVDGKTITILATYSPLYEDELKSKKEGEVFRYPTGWKSIVEEIV